MLRSDHVLLAVLMLCMCAVTSCDSSGSGHQGALQSLTSGNPDEAAVKNFIDNVAAGRVEEMLLQTAAVVDELARRQQSLPQQLWDDDATKYIAELAASNMPRSGWGVAPDIFRSAELTRIWQLLAFPHDRKIMEVRSERPAMSGLETTVAFISVRYRQPRQSPFLNGRPVEELVFRAVFRRPDLLFERVNVVDGTVKSWEPEFILITGLSWTADSWTGLLINGRVIGALRPFMLRLTCAGLEVVNSSMHVEGDGEAFATGYLTTVPAEESFPLACDLHLQDANGVSDAVVFNVPFLFTGVAYAHCYVRQPWFAIPQWEAADVRLCRPGMSQFLPLVEPGATTVDGSDRSSARSDAEPLAEHAPSLGETRIVEQDAWSQEVMTALIMDSGITSVSKLPFVDGFGAVVSPDGSKLAFHDVEGSLWMINMDGSQRTLLLGGSAWAGWGTWAPDSRRLSYVGRGAGNARGLYVVDITNPQHHTQIPGTSLATGFHAWAPQGDRIVYARAEVDESVEGSATLLYATDLRGSHKVVTPVPILKVCEREAQKYITADEPAWSPDGRWILFRQCDGSVYRLAMRASLLRRVLAWVQRKPVAIEHIVDNAEGAMWSSNGLWILYKTEDRQKAVSADLRFTKDLGLRLDPPPLIPR